MEDLIIMPDIETSGIHNKNLDPLPFTQFNLPKDLEEEFKEWIRFYNEDCHKTRHFIFKDEMADELNKRGRDLAIKLKDLYPDTCISYIGEDSLGYMLIRVIYLPK